MDSARAPALHGRTEHLQTLSAALDRTLAGRGAALVVRGEVGIGKSALLAAAGALAVDRGLRVLSATGVPSGAHVSYGGVVDLLDLPGLSALPGIGEGATQAAPHRVALATLSHLVADPAGRPTLLVVEDGHWLDGPSWAALTFLGRRLSDEPVVLLVAMREGVVAQQRLASAKLPELALGPLAGPDAAALLDEVAPDLDPAVRARVLADAAGNPLGVVEFGAAAARFGPGVLLPAWLPLSTRVEETFRELIAELPSRTRTLLLVAALHDEGNLDEILAAATELEGTPIGPAAIQPAVEAGLIRLDGGLRLRLRHPLLRSAVSLGASTPQRRLVHAALAAVLAGEPDRQVWHRAAATTGPDEELARELSEAARRTGPRDADAARALFERAAELTEDAGLRDRRRLAALQVAEQGGTPEDISRLAHEIHGHQLTVVDRAHLEWIRESRSGARWTNVDAAALAAFAEDPSLAGDRDWAIESLLALASRLHWSSSDARARQLIVTIADRLGSAATDPRLLCVLATVEPATMAEMVLDSLVVFRASMTATPRQLALLGSAATSVGALPLANRFFGAAVVGLRPQGLPGALMGQAWAAALLGDVRLAVSAANEIPADAVSIVRLATAQLAVAQAEALRGNGSVADAIADRVEQELHEAGANTDAVALVRGCAALGSGQFGEAYAHLESAFDAPTGSLHTRYSALGHLADAAVHCGRSAELRDRLTDLQAVARSCPAPLLQVNLAYAQAIVAPDDEAGDHLRQWLSGSSDPVAAPVADLAEWPFERARFQLAYGTSLRRQREQAESRALLRTAAGTFEALGASAWAWRARRELRAVGDSGLNLPPRQPVAEGGARPEDPIDRLTAQELQIARLAATGLRNREIAERLFLSPRTVTTHLTKIFPKLGIASRRELASLLTTHDPDSPPAQQPRP
jgi:DNA-binding CsgD family transcriptional regulator